MHTTRSSIENVPYGFPRSSVKYQGPMNRKPMLLTQIQCLRTVNLVQIHRLLRNDAQIEVALKRCPSVFRGDPSNFKVIQTRNPTILARMKCDALLFLRSSLKFQGHPPKKKNQLCEWFSPSVCLFVCLSVRPPVPQSVCLSHLHCIPITIPS